MRRSVLSLTFVLACGAPAAPVDPHANGERGPSVAAVVEGQPIYESAVETRMRTWLVSDRRECQAGCDFNARMKLRRLRVVDHLVDERLELLAGERQGIVISEGDVDAGLREIAARERIDVKTLLSEARRSGLDEHDYRKLLRAELLEQRLTSQYPSDVISPEELVRMLRSRAHVEVVR